MQASPITVLVPTWRRGEDLDRCMKALASQIRRPDAVLVVWRQGDETVHPVLDRWEGQLPLRRIEARRPGVVAAMNAGLDEAGSVGVLAITDDDAAPFPDWLQMLEHTYLSNPGLVAVGGRDRVHVHGSILPERPGPIGVLSWYGRAIGAHHQGTGSARQVDFLKGVNCSFRLDATRGRRFEERLLGTGAQQHWEMGFFLPLRASGGILFDPSILVDHYPAIRHDEDQRDTFNWKATWNGGHNETLVILDNLPLLTRPFFLLWAILIGHTAHPGFLQGLRLLLLRRATPWAAFGRTLATTLGRLHGVSTHIQSSKARS